MHSFRLARFLVVLVGLAAPLGTAAADCRLLPLATQPAPGSDFVVGCTEYILVRGGGSTTRGSYEALDLAGVPCPDDTCGSGTAGYLCRVRYGFPCCIDSGTCLPMQPGSMGGPTAVGIVHRFLADTDQRQHICYSEYTGNGQRVVLIPITGPLEVGGGGSCYVVKGIGRFFLTTSPDNLSGGIGLLALNYLGSALNHRPDCSAARASVAELWPPDHEMILIDIVGVTDPDGDPVTLSIVSVAQDEPVDGEGGTCPDAAIADGKLLLRAERAGQGNGRVYVVSFTASDGRGGRSEGTVNVGVPHDMRGGHVCVDDGSRFGSTQDCSPRRGPAGHVAGKQESPGQDPTLELAGMNGREATFDFALPEDTNVLLAVYDVAGRRLNTLESGPMSAGTHRVSWSTVGVRAGVYFCRMLTARGSITRSVVVFR